MIFLRKNDFCLRTFLKENKCLEILKNNQETFRSCLFSTYVSITSVEKKLNNDLFSNIILIFNKPLKSKSFFRRNLLSHTPTCPVLLRM